MRLVCFMNSSRFEGWIAVKTSDYLSRCENRVRIDLLVEDSVIVELKTVERILPIHEAQLLSYSRLSKLKLGLLINFNVKLLRDGVRRIVNNFWIHFKRRERRGRWDKSKSIFNANQGWNISKLKSCFETQNSWWKLSKIGRGQTPIRRIYADF